MHRATWLRKKWALSGKWPLRAQALSFVLHAGVLGAAAAYRPPLDPTPDIRAPDESAYLLYPTIAASAEREVDEQRLRPYAGDTGGPEDGRGLAQAGDTDGKLGTPETDQAHGGLTALGPPDNPDPALGAHGYGPWEGWWVGHPRPRWGDRTFVFTDREGMGLHRSQEPGNMDATAPAPAWGRAGTATSGAEQGSRPLACVPGAGEQTGPVHSVRSSGARPPAASRPAASAPPAPPLRRKTPGPKTVVQHVVCEPPVPGPWP